MFFYLQKSSNGVTMSTWLRPGPVYVKCHVRSKGDLHAHDAKLLEANPQYTHVRFNNICKTAVSLRNFARILNKSIGIVAIPPKCLQRALRHVIVPNLTFYHRLTKSVFTIRGHKFFSRRNPTSPTLFYAIATTCYLLWTVTACFVALC